MKKLSAFITMLLVSCSLFAQEEVKIKDGRTIIINSDGTWKYKLVTGNATKITRNNEQLAKLSGLPPNTEYSSSAKGETQSETSKQSAIKEESNGSYSIKLNQVIAEKSIKNFVYVNSFVLGKSTFSLNSIELIEPISQFSENEASSIVHFNFWDSYAEEKLVLKFSFKKNMDKQWVLTSVISKAGVGSQTVGDLIKKWGEINILIK